MKRQYEAISLHQPWASLVACGYKKIETRDWRIHRRGNIVIQAAKTKEWRPNYQYLVEHFDLKDMPKWEEMPFGAGVCLVEVVDCREMDEDIIASQTELERAVGNWRPGRFAWELKLIEKFPEPIPMRGSQGFFKCEV